MTGTFEAMADLDFELNDEELADLETPDPAVQKIRYSGQDFDVDGLFRRLSRGDIVIPNFGLADDAIETSAFQRSFVWRRNQMDKFIESMLLGYPIPGIFLVRQKDHRYLVLDGQQRLKTIQYFYSGSYNGRKFALRNVAEPFVGLTYETLPADLRRSLDNAFIQATIVDSDDSPSGLGAIYQIFERLNSGGTQLTAHEIRVALYAGPFIKFLQDLDSNPDWRELYGPNSQRVRDQELVLRILAFYVEANQYAAPLKSFLNDFAAQNKEHVSSAVAEAADLFRVAASLINRAVGPAALRRGSSQVNTSQTDALFVGLMRRLRAQEVSEEDCRKLVEKMKASEQLAEIIADSTSHEDRVSARLDWATKLFAGA